MDNTSAAILSAPGYSLYENVTKFIKAQIFRAIVSLAVAVRRIPILHGNFPTYTKAYANGLRHRIFIPRSWKASDAPLPLYLSIHGGGFVIGSPKMDDRFCDEFCNDYGILVVSLNYPKAPIHPFPAAPRALTRAVKDVLNDKTLPFDRSKVAIGGFSAGGNLAFAVSQDESLHGSIGGLVSFYGAMDLATPTATKVANEKTAGKDPMLEKAAPLFNWAYMKKGQNLRDPLLSPLYASEAKLPPKIYLIGCELDFLCDESEKMAVRLAKERNGGNTSAFSDSWEVKGIKWEKIQGVGHGFEARLTGVSASEKLVFEKKRKEMLDSAAQWLFREVY